MHIFQPDRFLLGHFVRTQTRDMTGEILDVGGGPRRYAHLFATAKKYATLDVDECSNPDILASAEEIPLPDACMDGVLCIETLMDVYGAEKAVGEMARVLRAGGKFVMTVSFLGALCDEPFHFWRFTPYSLERMLSPYFENIRIEWRGGYRASMVQLRVRYLIERFDLYQHPMLGHIVSAWSTICGRIAMARDRRDSSLANRKYAIGFNITATRT